MGDVEMDHGITVLAAACNGREYIVEQMDSILAQSQGGILLVVSDDCSTDGTADILDQYEAAHGNQVIVLHRTAGSGGAAAHFLGMLKLMADLAAGRGRKAWEGVYSLGDQAALRLEEAAHGDYFMLSDQDDVWLPEKTSVLLARMREMERGSTVDAAVTANGAENGGVAVTAHGAENPGAAVTAKDGAAPVLPILVHSDLRVVDQNLNEIAPSFFQYQKVSPERSRLSQLLVQNNVTGGSVMMNRSMLPYLERLPGACLMHDAWLALLACCFGRVGWVERPLYLYRQHSANTLGAKKSGTVEEMRNRLEDPGPAKRNYRLMFAQARSLLELYYDELSEEQRETLAAFAGLPRKSRLGKIMLMLRYGFTKNTALGTLGQMICMGD